MTIKQASHIYETLKDRKACDSGVDFSVNWLQMSYHYWNSKGNRSSVEALLNLWRKLIATGHNDLAADTMMIIMAKPSRPATTTRRVPKMHDYEIHDAA